MDTTKLDIGTKEFIISYSFITGESIFMVDKPQSSSFTIANTPIAKEIP